MSDSDRIPVLVFDDGTPNARAAMTRALDHAAEIVLATASDSPNTAANRADAADAGVPIDIVELAPHTGIRHALALCGERDIYAAYVPRVERHPGEFLRKIIQAAAQSEVEGLPVLAVTIVHPDAPTTGPVVELDPAHADAGFAALFAAGLAGTTRSPLHVLRLAGDRSNADTRSADALHAARVAIAHDEIAVYEQDGERDSFDDAIESSHGARAVVVGFGGVTIRGRKATHPDELPDSTLELPDGRLAHLLSQQISTDLVVVCDHIELQHGRVASVAAIGGAVGAITAGSALGGLIGLGAVSAAIGVAAAGYVVARDGDDDDGDDDGGAAEPE
ncbi:hypothetical protein [Ilumatobacter nonamiensis]|uniref:hypothetical protein n=1 Tax=Ilumatobacter nonamiensis TaxID=467093 RepID=UPI00034A028C|nr:hypothetical protein [Ilumatobacter nonamiensis]